MKDNTRFTIIAIILTVAISILLLIWMEPGEKVGHETCAGPVIEKDVTDGRYWAKVDCISSDSTVNKFNATLTQRQWNSTLAGGTWLRIENGAVVDVDNSDSRGCLAIPVTVAVPIVVMGLVRRKQR